ncbi:MAG: rod shape-determining protein MreC [Gammaproteobacteria bacterium]|nr:rod shape-determining protein MreC [Gammaproteobacteria bacterium]MBQ0838454.1 rod shape-determining protein MreC [Gammaproteobacteria bacterium]
MLILALAALTLIALDSFTSWLRPTHGWLEPLAQPFQWASTLPMRWREWNDESLESRAVIIANNDKLEAEILVYKAQLQRMAELSAQNQQLKSLLNGAELVNNRVLVAELVGISPDPFHHVITINRGVSDNISAGLAVIDGEGLMGQVVEVFDNHSRVLLITDSRHALPVYNLRNNARGIIEGSGDFQRLRLRHVSPTQDIQVGDTLLSSGLGQRFPSGYPVGTVSAIDKDPGQAFVEVSVTPAAKVDRSQRLLVIFSAVAALDHYPQSEQSPAPQSPAPPSSTPSDAPGQ